MESTQAIPLVRCRLDGIDTEAGVRYVPVADFGMWLYLMETRHRRKVEVEAISIWIPESGWGEPPDGVREEELEPVLRVLLELPGPHRVAVLVERFFPAETYPEALEALLAHFDSTTGPVKTRAGYFVGTPSPRTVERACSEAPALLL